MLRDRPGLLVALLCLAQVLGMAGNATFPALIPTFRLDWGLANAEAGWLGGLYYAGYVAAVPLLVAITDARDARGIYVASSLLGSLALVAFAFLAHDFWSALPLRLLSGVGLAGTYMVGLRLLSDRLPADWQSRGVGWYTAHFSIGASLSVLLAGEIARRLGWPAAFWIAGLLTAASGFLVLLVTRPLATRPSRPRQGHPLDLRPALRNRPALGYNLAYACHVWELFGFRAWLVAFLVFALALQGRDGLFGASATQLATLLLLLGMPASVAGSYLAERVGRRRLVTLVLCASAALAAGLGFAAAAPVGLLLVLLVAYSLLVMADSGALTGGAVLLAEPERKGATMAVHALLGFAAAFVSPVVFGQVLDLAGGDRSSTAWGLAFAVLGAGAIVGPLFLKALSRRAG
ncbi:Predicted arabinose efflux permease, MFS family [Tistlia consotensis]|uniref:Predicted arabinose efflux permease, MFS family n=1 Tax=Tistlia consotensis USBA 355 TaxID=560819 RepID=A0A1Y6BGU7_9PROT|nr:MFS transporter [Tistlia consotensis]SMF08415.1 Predicted arabinose efflux permease, MFS family [Tistlia consotensis USBA 355]SNR35387.1 Predicted arabinose efflux permease, MFS family [Tistlia consotensis]